MIHLFVSGTHVRKVVAFAVVMLIVVGNAWSQENSLMERQQEMVRKVQWGIKGGINIASLRFSNSDDSEDTKSVIGAVAGVTLDYAFTPNWHLHSGLEATMKGFEVELTNGRDLEVSATYLQIPIEVGYKFNIGKKWYIDPRLGFYVAYGVAGKSEYEGASKKINTFGDDILKKTDVGVGLGVYAGTGHFVFGIHGESGLIKANADNLRVSGAKVHTSNFAITAAYLF